MQRGYPVMFIIARRKGQRILIGDDIEVVVTELSRSTVKLGILAPRPFFIMRGELKDCVEQANRDALNTQLSTETEADLALLDQNTELDPRLVSVRAFLTPTVNNVAQPDVNVETSESALEPH